MIYRVAGKKIKISKRHKQWRAPKEFREYISYLFLYFRPMLWLGEYNLNIDYYEYLPIPADKKGDGASMDVIIDNTYLEITVRVAKKNYVHFLGKNYRRLAQTVLHELSHALTDPLATMLMDNVDKKLYAEVRRCNERQTERISSALFSFVQEKDYLPPKKRS